MTISDEDCQRIAGWCRGLGVWPNAWVNSHNHLAWSWVRSPAFVGIGLMSLSKSGVFSSNAKGCHESIAHLAYSRGSTYDGSLKGWTVDAWVGSKASELEFGHHPTPEEAVQNACLALIAHEEEDGNHLGKVVNHMAEGGMDRERSAQAISELVEFIRAEARAIVREEIDEYDHRR